VVFGLAFRTAPETFMDRRSANAGISPGTSTFVIPGNAHCCPGKLSQNVLTPHRHSGVRPLLSGETLAKCAPLTVIPANAGIQLGTPREALKTKDHGRFAQVFHWIPACAGMTIVGFRGNLKFESGWYATGVKPNG
jgi:hypothetical protein